MLIQMHSPFHRSVPLHYQIERVLRSAIEAGDWSPDEQLPTEMALVRRFRVSRTTVREALGTLERAGLIVRRRGRGTFVRDGRMLGAAGTPITNLVLGYEAEIRVLGIDTVVAPAPVASFLSVPRGHTVARFRRLEIVDGKPLAVVINHMRVELGRRIRARDLERHSLLELLRDRLKIRLRPIRHVIEARMPDEAVASLLGIDLTQPILVLRLLVSDTRGEPVEIAETFYRADRYRYESAMPLLSNRRIRKGPSRSAGDGVGPNDRGTPPAPFAEGHVTRVPARRGTSARHPHAARARGPRHAP